jgi:hypothetical protein
MGRDSLTPDLRPSSFHLQPNRAASDGMVANDDQRDVVFFRESRQADGDRAWQRGRTVEHHQAERAAAQEDVGAPGAPVGAGRPDHPESPAVAGFSPFARCERARPVDDGDPAARRHRRRHELPDERCPPAAERALDLRQPAVGNPSIRERAIQRLDPGGDRGGTSDPWRRQNRRQLLAEGG